MKKRVILTLIGILLIALILNAIFTWGIVFDQDGGFEWSGDYIFEDIFTEEQTGRITLRDDYTEFPICIPGVFYVYLVDAPPYMVRLDIDDETESLEKIFIELISIEYFDGQKIEHRIDWEGEFVSGSLLMSVNSRNTRIPAMRFSGKLPLAVDRRESFRIKLVGYFLDKKEDKIPFDTIEFFEYEPYSWRVYPLLGSF